MPLPCAPTIPLVTVIPLDVLENATGLLPLTQRGSSTHAAELAFGLPPSRYFYAGRAHPRFGDCALVYHPSVEGLHSGSANPFDTGGVYWGHSHPFCGPVGDRDRVARGKALVEQTKSALSDWRAQFAGSLDAAFPTPAEYFRKAPRKKRPWGPDELPAWDERNHGDFEREWRSWTPEIRFHEEHEATRELDRWACHPGVLKRLRRARSTGALKPLATRLEDFRDGLLKRKPLVDSSFCDKINHAISSRYE